MNDYIKQRISDYKEKEKPNTMEAFDRLTLFIYGVEDNQGDLDALAKILPYNYLRDIIKHYGGGILKIPDQERFKEALLLAVVYYLYDIKKMNWSQIKKLLCYDKYFMSQNFISMGKKIIKIRNLISKELLGIMASIPQTKVLDEIISKQKK